MDNDGFIDMVVSDVDVDIPGCNRRFTLLQNNGGNNMFNPNDGTNLSWNLQGSHDTVVIDINRDGFKDLFMATCESYHMFVNTAEAIIGDVNCDGTVNLLDVDPFIDLLASGGFKFQADTNGDGIVNLLDVSGFITALSGG